MGEADYEIVVDSESIAAAAADLNRINSEIQSEFERLEKRSKILSSDWNSPAGNNAVTKMYELFKNSEARFAVLQNYANFLEQQVNPNYNSAEDTNTSLADQFK